MEHLDTRQGCLDVGTETDNLDFTAFSDDTSLNTSSSNGTATGDGEGICDTGNQTTGSMKPIGFQNFTFDGHQEWFLEVP